MGNFRFLKILIAELMGVMIFLANGVIGRFRRSSKLSFTMSIMISAGR
jgi:hypothetical protein